MLSFFHQLPPSQPPPAPPPRHSHPPPPPPLSRCWGLLTYFQGSQLVKTAALDPSHRYIFAGHPHGLLGNAWFLAWCTDLLGFQRLFPGIRLSVGE